MSPSLSSSTLRLVGHDEDRQAWREREDARSNVARANVAAARTSLDPTDPRWVLAVRTQTHLEGSVLRPEARERVLRTAKTLGIRPFDANVIIALVQDRARRGESLGAVAPALEMLADPKELRKRGPGAEAWRLATAVLGGIVGTMLLIRWLLG